MRGLEFLLEMDRTGMLFSFIQRLHAGKEPLRHELEEASPEIDAQSAKYSRLLNGDVPIYRLPDEILTHIFFLVQRNFTTHNPDGSGIVPLSHVNASHVSHRWRSIVLATPLLWNTISFHIRPANNAFERVISLFDAHLLRSAKCFLDIDLHFYDTQVDLAPYLSRLAVHASRWRRLSISAYFPQPHMDALKELLCTADARVLEHLSLTLGPSEIERRPRPSVRAYTSMDGTILIPGAPALTFVRLGGYAIGEMHPPLHLITTLHLDNWTCHYITPNEVARILASVPRIVNLSLNRMSMIQMPHDPTVFPQSVRLPHLRQLHLYGATRGGQLSYPASYCKLIDAPDLNELTLGIPLELPFRQSPFESTPLPSVRHITLDGGRFHEEYVKWLAHATPNVVSLTAEKTVQEILKGLGPWESPRAVPVPPWPALRTLELRDMDIEDVPYLCNLVLMLHVIGALGKDRCGCGLSRISLDRRGRAAMRARNRLDWLKEYVEVVESDERESWPFGLGYRDTHHENI